MIATAAMFCTLARIYAGTTAICREVDWTDAGSIRAYFTPRAMRHFIPAMFIAIDLTGISAAVDVIIDITVR